MYQSTRLKDLDDRLNGFIKSSKNELIPILEKRINGMREEIDTKANTLDLKKLIPDINEVCKLKTFININ